STPSRGTPTCIICVNLEVTLAAGVGCSSGRLRLTVLPEDRLQMKWRESEGSSLGYLVQVKPMAGDPEQEVMLTTKTPKATVGGLSPSKEYTVQIFQLAGSGKVLLARREFVIQDLKSNSVSSSGWRPLGAAPEPTPSRVGDPDLEPRVALAPSQDPPTLAGPQFRCTPPTPADVVFLVDGSWSVGHSHFQQVKDFLASVLEPFEIGPDKVQVGLTQYSGAPQTEWDLNALGTKEQVLAAVRGLRLRGGNTFTGLALTHVLEQNLKPEAGLRPEAAKLVVLVTDGKSQDDARTAGHVLKGLGVDVFAVGVKNADEAELRLLASQPLDITVHSVQDFPQLSALAGLLGRLICQKLQGRSTPGGPVTPAAAALALGPLPAITNLVMTRVASRSVHLARTPPRSRHLRPPAPAAPARVGEDGPASSAQLHSLTPRAESRPPWPPSARPGSASCGAWRPRAGAGVPPAALTLASVTSRTLRLTWQPSAGAAQYLVRCSPASSKGEGGREVRVGRPEVLLDGLAPGRDYDIWVQSVRGVATSEARSIRARTPALGPPRPLSFSEVSHDSARVSWEGSPRPVRLFRVSYVSSKGGHSGQVRVPGNATSATLGPLSSSTTYSVRVTCVYPGGSSSTLTGRLSTRKVPSPSQLSVTELPGDEVRLEWAAAAASGVLVYQITWTPLGDGKAREVSVPGNLGAAVLPGLGRHSEYEIAVLAYYRDGARSDPVSLHYNPRSPPSNLALASESPTSLRVSWMPPSGPVLHYRLTYALASGLGPEKSISVPGSRSHVTLPDLLAATKYRVLVSAVYGAGESVAMSATGRTAACPALRPNGSLPGFDLMAAFGLVEKEYASVRGVSMEPSAFGPAKTFTLFKDAQLTRRTSDVRLAALPPEHTIVFVLRLLPETPREAFALWQVAAQDFQPVLGVLLDAGRKSLTYFNRDPRDTLQEVTFDLPEVRTIFFGSFHKVHVAVGRSKVRLYVDCRKVAEKAAGEAGSLPAVGFVTLGRLAKARGPRSSSASFQLQMLQVVCSDSWAEEDGCCELPASVGGQGPAKSRRVGADGHPGRHGCRRNQDRLPGGGGPGAQRWSLGQLDGCAGGPGPRGAGAGPGPPPPPTRRRALGARALWGPGGSPSRAGGAAQPCRALAGPAGEERGPRTQGESPVQASWGRRVACGPAGRAFPAFTFIRLTAPPSPRDSPGLSCWTRPPTQLRCRFSSSTHGALGFTETSVPSCVCFTKWSSDLVYHVCLRADFSHPCLGVPCGTAG
uniref:Collagen type XX alpha 1 chain n=1 Tax=Catagonus wagneri TaxID=51154 RepID=A0A8C3X3K0_9CETA